MNRLSSLGCPTNLMPAGFPYADRFCHTAVARALVSGGLPASG